MKYFKKILSFLAFMYALPAIYILLDTGNISDAISTFFLQTFCVVAIGTLSLIAICWLPPVWIFLAWYFFGRSKN